MSTATSKNAALEWIGENNKEPRNTLALNNSLVYKKNRNASRINATIFQLVHSVDDVIRP